MVWSGPAVIVGGEETVITTVSCWSGQPGEDTVRRKVFSPAESAESAEVGFWGSVMVAEPFRIVQRAVPKEVEPSRIV